MTRYESVKNLNNWIKTILLSLYCQNCKIVKKFWPKCGKLIDNINIQFNDFLITDYYSISSVHFQNLCQKCTQFLSSADFISIKTYLQNLEKGSNWQLSVQVYPEYPRLSFRSTLSAVMAAMMWEWQTMAIFSSPSIGFDCRFYFMNCLITLPLFQRAS